MEAPLTNDEQDRLRAAGYVYAGARADSLTEQPYLKFIQNGKMMHGNRAYWRGVIADLPPVVDALAQLRAELAEAQAENARLRAALAAMKNAAKTLQRVQFIFGGYSGIVADCDEAALRENAERALALMREMLPPIVAALEDTTP